MSKAEKEKAVFFFCVKEEEEEEKTNKLPFRKFPYGYFLVAGQRDTFFTSAG